MNQCNYVVLDEADRMIDLGFERQVAGVLDAMSSSNLKPENDDERLDETSIYRTTYMFSATMPSWCGAAGAEILEESRCCQYRHSRKGYQSYYSACYHDEGEQ